MMRRYWPILLVLLAGCTSVARPTMIETKHHKIEVEATAIPVGFLNEFLEVCTEVDGGRVDCAMMPATSAGQAIVNTGTTLGSVAGATVGVYEGLKASGSGISIP